MCARTIGWPPLVLWGSFTFPSGGNRFYLSVFGCEGSVLDGCGLGRLCFGSARFTGLVAQHVFGILLVTGPCSTFVLRSSKHVSRGVFGRCASLSLHCPPHFSRISARRRTLTLLTDVAFSLIVYVPNAKSGSDFSVKHRVGDLCRRVPVIVLAPFDRNVATHVTSRSLDTFSCIFY